MFATLLWGLCFVVGMILTIPILLFCYLVKLLFGDRIADKFIYVFTRFWGRAIVSTTGARVSVTGSENVPDAGNLCCIANHQSFFDIPLLIGWLGVPLGFIAKKELKKIPVLNGWITIIHSAFIDRSNPRRAIESISKGAESIRNGHPIVIFPEGTRSKTSAIAEFKAGSLKLPLSSQAVILPVTIKGTRLMYEATQRIRRTEVSLTIHKPIHPDDAIYNDKTALAKHLQQIISSV